MTSSRNLAEGIFWATTAIFVWSASLIMLRVGVKTSLTPYDLTALRFSVAAVFLLPVLIRKKFRPKWPGTGSMLLMIILFGAPYVLLLSLAVKTTSSSNAGALNPGIMAISSVIMSRIFYSQKLTVASLTGTVLIVLGILGFIWASGGLVSGDFVLLVTGIMWAAYAAFVRTKSIPALQATMLITIGSAVLYLPVYMLGLPSGLSHTTLSDIVIQAFFQGVMVTIIAVYAFSRSAELLGPIAGTSLPALIPVVTLGLEIPILGEIPPLSEILAACLVTFGIAFILTGINANRRKKANSLKVPPRHTGL